MKDYDVREEKEKYNILIKESWLCSGRPKKEKELLEYLIDRLTSKFVRVNM